MVTGRGPYFQRVNTLRTVYADAASTTARSGCVRVESGSSDAGAPYDVLVVDDNHALAAVVAESLEHIDNELRASYTTEPGEALAQLRQDRIDCLVTDYEMPELDGLALVDRDETDTPFVVFTQRRDEGVTRAIVDRGGAYLPKGAGREQYRRLATLVHEQLGRDCGSKQ